MAPIRYGCNGCEKTWGGLRTGHCSTCHETFTGLKQFDKHRDGPHSKRFCVNPALALDDKGEPIFVLAERPYRCWTLNGYKPSGEEDE